ncbi:hypothetical protein DVH05_010077 [Phytophthora capsici]|nr:hypothetical protein DVH05_010077 [Phytophthora capsici]
MSGLNSPKGSDNERPPVMEKFKQSNSTRKLNTQASVPMLGAGGKQYSQDLMQWESPADPTGNYARAAEQPPKDANEFPSTSTFDKLASLLCCCRR